MSKNIGNVAGGYKASIANPRVSEGAREHARDELGQIQSHENDSTGNERHDANVKRGLKAAVHNPNVTDVGREEARTKFEDMGGKIEEPAD